MSRVVISKTMPDGVTKVEIRKPKDEGYTLWVINEYMEECRYEELSVVSAFNLWEDTINELMDDGGAF